MLDGGINAKRPFVGKRVIAENYRYVASYDLCVSNLYARKDARREHVCLNRPIFAISAKRGSLSAVDWQ